MDKSLEQFILVAPVLLFSMVAHEYAHGYAALKQGDNTAYALGRLTWNPLPHIDPLMSILLPLLTYFTTGIAFGGAKPVPVIPRNYRNFKRGDIIVSLAGVATNFVVESTARYAADADYRVIILEDCCAAFSDEAHACAIASLDTLVEISTSEDFLASIR